MAAAIGVVFRFRLFSYWRARWNCPIARSLVAVSPLDSSSVQRGATVITVPFDVVVKTHGGFFFLLK